MTASSQRIVIIGNGIAGVTAARHIRKYSDFEITIISSESEYFWSRTALMYIYMGHMKFEHTKPYEDHFWRENRIQLVQTYIQRIDHENHQVLPSNGPAIPYDKLILATGSVSNKFDWPGQDLHGVTGMVSLQDLERIEDYTLGINQAVVVGGGLIGVELAEMLCSRNIDVTFLIREKHFWANVLPSQEAAMIASHLERHGVKLLFSSELKEIFASPEGRVRGILTTSGDEIPCDFVGLAAGVHPNTAMAHSSGIPVKRGILVNKYFETEIPDIYAIGDCAEQKEPPPGRKTVEQVWYTGRMMGETLAQTITGTKTAYQPGPWFNSAKFFDIEYQTYGNVPSELPDNMDEFYWQGEEKALHFVFEKDTGRFIGINSYGIRLRHAFFDQWLRKKTVISEVMTGLPESGFDPEFFDQPFRSVISGFNAAHPRHEIELKRKKILGIF